MKRSFVALISFLLVFFLGTAQALAQSCELGTISTRDNVLYTVLELEGTKAGRSYVPSAPYEVQLIPSANSLVEEDAIPSYQVSVCNPSASPGMCQTTLAFLLNDISHFAGRIEIRVISNPNTTDRTISCSRWFEIEDNQDKKTVGEQRTREEAEAILGTGGVIDGSNVTNGVFDALNPLKFGQDKDRNIFESAGIVNDLSTPRGIIQRVFVFGFPIAGLILILMIIWGGIQPIFSASSKKSFEDGRKRIQAAILGFVMLFASYWMIQVVEQVFGVTILGN